MIVAGKCVLVKRIVLKFSICSQTTLFITIQQLLGNVKESNKILGVRFDKMNSFSNNLDSVNVRCQKGLQILKVLAGQEWGQSKEILLMTYKATIRPLIDYCCPIWFPKAKACLDFENIILIPSKYL